MTTIDRGVTCDYLRRVRRGVKQIIICFCFTAIVGVAASIDLTVFVMGGQNLTSPAVAMLYGAIAVSLFGVGIASGCYIIRCLRLVTDDLLAIPEPDKEGPTP